MDVEFVVLRLIHVALGAFWVGAAIFVARLLAPGAGSAWPGSASVTRQVLDRFQRIVAITSGLTVLAGLRLYWRDATQGPAWTGSPTGIAFAAGGLAGIVALVMGGIVLRRGAGQFSRQVAASEQAVPPADREAHLAEAHVTLTRLTGALSWMVVLLLVTIALMAVARYL